MVEGSNAKLQNVVFAAMEVIFEPISEPLRSKGTLNGRACYLGHGPETVFRAINMQTIKCGFGFTNFVSEPSKPNQYVVVV